MELGIPKDRTKRLEKIKQVNNTARQTLLENKKPICL